MSRFFNEDVMEQENLYPISEYVYFYGNKDKNKENEPTEKTIKHIKKRYKVKLKEEKPKKAESIPEPVKGMMLLEEPKYGDSILLGNNTLFYTLAYLIDEDEPEVVNDILDTFINIEDNFSSTN